MRTRAEQSLSFCLIMPPPDSMFPVRSEHCLGEGAKRLAKRLVLIRGEVFVHTSGQGRAARPEPGNQVPPGGIENCKRAFGYTTRRASHTTPRAGWQLVGGVT